MTGAPTFVDDAAGPRLAWIRDHRPQLERVPLPGSGGTVERLRSLAALGALDGALVRLAEGHLDAVAIRDELGADRVARGRGVGRVGRAAGAPRRRAGRIGMAAVRGPSRGARAPPASTAPSSPPPTPTAAGPLFAGRRRRCLTSTTTGGRSACGPATRAPGTSTCRLDAPLGPVECYVERAGFWHGGVGVAACWHGLAERLADDTGRAGRPGRRSVLVKAAAAERPVPSPPPPPPGRAGRQIDDDPTDIRAAQRRAQLVRVAVAGLARPSSTSRSTPRAPAPCASTPDHARAVADLTVYVRQLHHGRDVAAIELAADDDWWSS